MINNLAVIIVTYNRKDLLLENLRLTLSQTLNIDKVIIVDNHGEDNTKEYLMKNKVDFSKIIYLYLKDNIGGAGGFYTGLKYAYEKGYKWFILMDDDGKPINSETFKNMSDYIERKNNLWSDKIFYNSLVIDGKKLSFALKGTNIINNLKSYEIDGIINNEVNPFNASLISRGLIDEIGFPNKDFFIKGDEVDYMKRALNAKAKVATIMDSLYFHPSIRGIKQKKFLNKTFLIYVEAPWKEYYSIRNAVFSNTMLGNKKESLKILLKKILYVFMYKCDKKETVKMIVKGYRDGKKGKLGAVIKP